MAKIEDGADAAKLLKVIGTTKGLRSTDRAEGENYVVSAMSGLTTTVAADGEVYQFRWTDSSYLCVLNYLRIRAQVITGFTAAQQLAFEALPVSGFSVAGTGGTQIAPASTTLKKKSTFATSRLAEARIATTAALGAGTKTISGAAFLAHSMQELAAAATVARAQGEAVFSSRWQGGAGLIFGQNEGFIIRNNVLMGAAGTVRWVVEASWDEVLAADYLF